MFYNGTATMKDFGTLFSSVASVRYWHLFLGPKIGFLCGGAREYQLVVVETLFTKSFDVG